MTSHAFEEDMPGGSREREHEQNEHVDRRGRDEADDDDAPPRRASRQRRQDVDDDDDDDDEGQEPKSKKKLIIVGGGAAVVLFALLYTGTGTKLYDMATGQNAAPPPVTHHSSRPKLANQNRVAKRSANQNADEGLPQTGGDAQALFPPSDDDSAPPRTARRRMAAQQQDADQDTSMPLQARTPGDMERIGRPGSADPMAPAALPFPASGEPQASASVGTFSKDVVDKLNSVLTKLDDMTKKMAEIEKISERQEAKIEQGAIAVVNMSAKLDSLVGRMNDQQANIESLKDTIHTPAPKKAPASDDTDTSKTAEAPQPKKTAKKEEAVSSHSHVIRGYILKGVSEGDPPTSVFIKTPNGAIMKNINEDVGGSAGVIKEIRQIKGGSWEVVTTKGIIPAG